MFTVSVFWVFFVESHASCSELQAKSQIEVLFPMRLGIRFVRFMMSRGKLSQGFALSEVFSI